MPRGRCAAIGRGRPWVAAALPALVLGLVGCSDDDDDASDAVAQESAATETTTDFIVEVTPPVEMQASADPDFLPGVLADDVVTADELDAAYQGFIGCLTEGGAAGIYAYDIALHIDITSDWSLASADADPNAAASLNASCSRDFLGDLISRYEAANPDEPDIVVRQRENIVECLNAVNPAIAAELPDDITVDTSGEGPSFAEMQLDPTELDEELQLEEGQILAVNRCVGSVGADWIEFG